MSPRAAGLMVSPIRRARRRRAGAGREAAGAGRAGAIHTWAPADKHGFGTAHQLAGHA